MSDAQDQKPEGFLSSFFKREAVPGLLVSLLALAVSFLAYMNSTKEPKLWHRNSLEVKKNGDKPVHRLEVLVFNDGDKPATKVTVSIHNLDSKKCKIAVTPAQSYDIEDKNGVLTVKFGTLDTQNAFLARSKIGARNKTPGEEIMTGWRIVIEILDATESGGKLGDGSPYYNVTSICDEGSGQSDNSHVSYK